MVSPSATRTDAACDACEPGSIAAIGITIKAKINVLTARSCYRNCATARSAIAATNRKLRKVIAPDQRDADAFDGDAPPASVAVTA